MNGYQRTIKDFKEVLFDLHRRMVRIRLLEEAAGQLASEARIPVSSIYTLVKKQ